MPCSWRRRCGSDCRRVTATSATPTACTRGIQGNHGSVCTDRHSVIFLSGAIRLLRSTRQRRTKTFLSRGNGWVFAGCWPAFWKRCRAGRRKASVRNAVQGDGSETEDYAKAGRLLGSITACRAGWTPPESSGTGFSGLRHGLGVKAGLLDRATYEPARATRLARSGRGRACGRHVGSVQQVSDRPEQVAPSDTQFYGVGAFLLAGSAVYDLYLQKSWRDRRCASAVPDSVYDEHVTSPSAAMKSSRASPAALNHRTQARPTLESASSSAAAL